MAQHPITLSLSKGLSLSLAKQGRAIPPEKRSIAMGIVSAAGSFGQFARLPGTLGLLEWLGWSAALHWFISEAPLERQTRLIGGEQG
ncbi:hypothetical protein [Halomonas massiliensis]|uniref:hypothetical protein n=1 Tax=Vreelandella massiliensis TaxID=1816686 RepID=UPI00096ABF54